MRIVTLLASAVVLATPLAVSAQTTEMQRTPIAATDAKGKGNAKDPNRMVCKTMESTGSRLGAKRECRTASEWATISAEQRRDIERNQALRYNGNN